MSFKKTFSLIENINSSLKVLREADDKTLLAATQPPRRIYTKADIEAIPDPMKIHDLAGENLPEVPPIKPQSKRTAMPPEIEKQRITYKEPPVKAEDPDKFSATASHISSLPYAEREEYIKSLKNAPFDVKDHHLGVVLYAKDLAPSIRQKIWDHASPEKSGYDIQDAMAQYREMLKRG